MSSNRTELISKQILDQLCDTGSIHSWISDKLSSRLGFSVFPTRVTLNGIVTKDVIDTQRVKCDVTSVYAEPSFSFDLKPFTKPISLGNEHIDIPELQKRYPHLAPIPPIV